MQQCITNVSKTQIKVVFIMYAIVNVPQCFYLLTRYKIDPIRSFFFCSYVLHDLSSDGMHFTSRWAVTGVGRGASVYLPTLLLLGPGSSKSVTPGNGCISSFRPVYHFKGICTCQISIQSVYPQQKPEM